MKVQVNVSDVPEDIRERVLADARERDLSLQQVIGEIVARCHGMTWNGRGQKLRRGANGQPPWILRLPRELAEALETRAQQAGGRRVAKSRLILNCLAEHYGLPLQSPLNRSLGQQRDESGRFERRS